MWHTNPVSARKKPVHLLSMALALGVALFASPGSAAPPPAASSVTVYNCLVLPTTPVDCGGGQLCAAHLNVTFSSFNSNDITQTIPYGTSPYIASRASSTASPSSATLQCATSDGCVIEGMAEGCGGSASPNSCGLDATATTLTANQAIELDRIGFDLSFSTWTGVCRTQVCTGCVP